LNGMFAFAIYDKKNKNVYIARDRLGIKPLYYAKVGSVFIFASEIKALLKFPGINKSADYKALSSYLTFRYTYGNQSYFQNIKKLSESIKSFFLNHKFKNNLQEINTQKIIFIMGMPRSGTTLVEKIISSHSNVSGLGELNIFSNIISSNIIKDHEINISIIDDFLSKDLSESYMFYLKNFKYEKEYITDKSLTNFWFLGFIKHFFPNSKIIHCSRNPRDNCLSIYKTLFDVHEAWFYNQE